MNPAPSACSWRSFGPDGWSIATLGSFPGVLALLAAFPECSCWAPGFVLCHTWKTEWGKAAEQRGGAKWRLRPWRCKWPLRTIMRGKSVKTWFQKRLIRRPQYRITKMYSQSGPLAVSYPTSLLDSGCHQQWVRLTMVWRMHNFSLLCCSLNAFLCSFPFSHSPKREQNCEKSCFKRLFSNAWSKTAEIRLGQKGSF